MSPEIELLRLTLFLAACAAAAQISAFARVPSILAHLAVGAVLGPPLAQFAPAAEGLKLAGRLGVTMSVMNAGLKTKLSQIRECAARAASVAILAVIFPLIEASVIMICRDLIQDDFETKRSLKTAFAVGSALTPTSLGITTALLATVGELNTKFGTTICVAAVLADVLSLILLAQVDALRDKTLTAWVVIRPIMFAIVFIGGSLVIAAYLPKIFDYGLRVLPIPQQFRGRIGLWLLVVLTLGMVYAAMKAHTSFLLAAYLAGVAFASVRQDMGFEPWRVHIFPYIEWLAILFFAATIGFIVPLKAMFSGNVLGLGALLAVASVTGKLLSGLAMLPRGVDGMGVGVAMLARGEFSFLIAAQVREAGLVSERDYAAMTWSIVIPTFLVTFLFTPVFNFRSRRIQKQMAAQESLPEVSSGPKSDEYSLPMKTGTLDPEKDVNITMPEPLHKGSIDG